MIGIIRRLSGSSDPSHWDIDRQFEPEAESMSGTELTSTLQAGRDQAFSPSEMNMRDYCKEIIQTAIDRQGWYGGMKMSVPWLRMTLAGLESRSFAPELMWEGVEEPGSERVRTTGMPSYDAVFEAERALVHKLRLK